MDVIFTIPWFRKADATAQTVTPPGMLCCIAATLLISPAAG
jgi:hypothetical protein